MAKRTRWLAFVFVAILALVGVALLVRPGDSVRQGRPSDGIGDVASSESDTDAEEDTPVEARALTVTPEPGEIAPPKKKRTPASPASPAAPAAPSGASPPAAQPAKPDPDYQRYLDETRAVVVDNVPSLTETADAVMRALAASDRIALTSLAAPGEGDQSDYLAALAVRYPAIQSVSGLNTVNIHSAGGVTIYTAYRLVIWEDAGIASQHTIPIPLRFVNGRWQLTSLADTGSDPQFVQAVTL